MKLLELQLTLPDLDEKTLFKSLYNAAEHAIDEEVLAGVKRLFPNFVKYEQLFSWCGRNVKVRCSDGNGTLYFSLEVTPTSYRHATGSQTLQGLFDKAIGELKALYMPMIKDALEKNDRKELLRLQQDLIDGDLDCELTAKAVIVKDADGKVLFKVKA